MKKAELNNHEQLLSTEAVDLSRALILNGKTLEPQPVKHSNPVEQKFKTEKEFTELVAGNGKMLFGEHTLMIDATKTPLGCYLLLDFREVEKFKFYFVDVTHSKENFWDLFARITKLFTLLALPEYPSDLTDILEELISENKPLKKELNALLGGIEVSEQLFINKPFILLLTDQERPELIQMTMTYSGSWGKYVKPMLLKKYEDNGTLFCAISPLFADIDFSTNGKNGKAREKNERLTEADHLENVSDDIRNIYQTIKAELLKEDAGIELNPKQYYVSMRKDKNLAFFHIKKKRISLVVMNPEEDTRKQILHHEVKTLTESVQKFWNGPSCTIVIENTEKLDEVTALLKTLIKSQG